MSLTLGLILALAVLVAVGLAVGLPLLDRACGSLAERKAGEFLSVPFGRPATVRVLGRSFLVQALRGRYGDVRISGGGLRIGEMTDAALDARLRHVRLPVRELLGRRADELTCDRLSGQVVLPYAELARVSGIPGLELRPSLGKVIATAAVPVPGLSQLARVNGRAVLSLGEANTLWLRVRGVSVAGINLPGIVLNQLLPSLDVPIALPALPYGLRVDELRPTQDGLVVLGSARGVVFARPPGGDIAIPATDARASGGPAPIVTTRPRPRPRPGPQRR